MSLHIGIIMDGNGRWATAQNKPRLSGHEAGVQTVKEVVTSCPDMGIHTVTLFAFAVANWKRDTEEVDGLWKLFHHFFTEHISELAQKGVRIRVIGDREGLPEQIQKDVAAAEEKSKNNTKLLLQVALNYDGIDEVSRFIKWVVENEVSSDAIDADFVNSHLDTEADNEPDIIIRTGMDTPNQKHAVWRSSGFLPIQSAQSVCVSTTTLWPDFTVDELKEIILYAKPDDRLYGGQRA